ncbi:MAG TPA: hypothetical protein VFQ65_12405 [Kofleriaceae bacterium]|nr:hypothetical protein [Kofleriaceae bacterium]
MLKTLALVIAVLAACKGKPERRDPPSNAQSGSSIATKPTGADQGSDKVLHLPHGNGSAPKQTKGPLTRTAIDRMLALRFEGFGLQNDENQPLGVIAVVIRTIDRPKFKVTVQIRPCKDTCMPIDLAKWQARTDLKNDVMGPEMRTSPDIKFSIGATDVNAMPMIYTYQYGIMKSAEGTRYTDTYALWFNDGNYEIRSIATYADNPPDSVEQLLKLAPQADLESLAKAFMDVYTQAWVD